ncbi:MAG: hypothetical protein V1736_08640 [Pseudomonadota bacterium]
MNEMIGIYGIGWIDETGYGSVKKQIRTGLKDLTDPEVSGRRDLFSYPFKGFSRLDKTSKTACCAVALALKDAGMDYSQEHKHKTGIIGANPSGCLQSDVEYFKDYIENGRVMSRGNLFIYTLPSSPLGEAAIHFRLQGPLFYMFHRDHPESVLDTAAEMILLDEAPTMLAGVMNENDSIFFVLGRGLEPGTGILCGVEQARVILGQTVAPSTLAARFSTVNTGPHE